MGQIKLCMDPVNQNPKKKNSKFSIFNMQNRTYVKKNASAKKKKKYYAFMYLERSVLMSRFQN